MIQKLIHTLRYKHQNILKNSSQEILIEKVMRKFQQLIVLSNLIHLAKMFQQVTIFHLIIRYHLSIRYHLNIIYHIYMIDNMDIWHHPKLEIKVINKQIINKYWSKINRSCFYHNQEGIKSTLIYYKRNNNKEKVDYNILYQIKWVHLVFPIKDHHQDYLVKYQHLDYHIKDPINGYIVKLWVRYQIVGNVLKNNSFYIMVLKRHLKVII